MALVKRFNVNREQVTLDADIIENMSANDVSYNDSSQYDENTVGDKLSELEREINGKSYRKVFTVVGGQQYAWSNIIEVNIKAGETFTFVANCDNSVKEGLFGIIGVTYADTPTAKNLLGGNLSVGQMGTYTADKDIIKIYAPYVIIPTGSGDIICTLVVSKRLTDEIKRLTDEIKENTNNIKTVDDEITGSKFLIKKWDGYSYNPGNGILEAGLNTRFSTKKISVKAGMLMHIIWDNSIVLYAVQYSSDVFKGSLNVGALYKGHNYYRVSEGVDNIAFTLNGDFDSIQVEMIPSKLEGFISLESKETQVQTRDQVPRDLRKKGLIISYVFDNTPIVEQYIAAIGSDPTDNYFQQDTNWIRLSTTKELKGLLKHPMSGKTFFSIGDSLRWAWCAKLAELTGSTFGGDIFAPALEQYEDKYISRYQAEAKYIIDLYNSGTPVDYIFIEYVHSYFVNDVDDASRMFYFGGDITEVEPFVSEAVYGYPTLFDTPTLAESYWNNNFSSIIGGFSPIVNAIVNLSAKRKTQTPKFKLTGSSTSTGQFTIKFHSSNGTNYSMAIGIEAGMTINEALTKVNEIEFADSGCKWNNVNAHSVITDSSLYFEYSGNNTDADASILMQFDFGTTGITTDDSWAVVDKGVVVIQKGFHSHDVTDWNNPDKWHNLMANFDSYKWCKGLIEMLQSEIPSAKIVIFTMPFDMWTYATGIADTGENLKYPDGTFNVQALYNTERHKRVIQNWEGWKKVACYYNTQFVPVGNINGISPINYSHYYSTNNVHPYQNGYDRTAEILSENIY